MLHKIAAFSGVLLHSCPPRRATCSIVLSCKISMPPTCRLGEQHSTSFVTTSPPCANPICGVQLKDCYWNLLSDKLALYILGLCNSNCWSIYLKSLPLELYIIIYFLFLVWLICTTSSLNNYAWELQPRYLPPNLSMIKENWRGLKVSPWWIPSQTENSVTSSYSSCCTCYDPPSMPFIFEILIMDAFSFHVHQIIASTRYSSLEPPM